MLKYVENNRTEKTSLVIPTLAPLMVFWSDVKIDENCCPFVPSLTHWALSYFNEILDK